MIELLLAAALAVEAAQFEVHTLDGRSALGELVALDGQQLVLQSDDGRQSFQLAELAALAAQPAPHASARNAALLVELVDGSVLPATAYTVASGTAQVRLTDDVTHKIPARLIRLVRFGAPESHDPKLTKQWSEIVETEAAGDLLVVRKKDALDYIDGVLRDIDADTCQFEIDGEVIPVKRSKIEGLVYSQPQREELPEPIGKLFATDGSRLQLASVELAGAELVVSTPAGMKYKAPLDRVARFDFSSGKIAYLSDLDPESVEFTPLIGFEQPPQGLLTFYAYRRDEGFERNPLRLDGKVFRKGLALASRTRLVYKLPGKFRVFRATLGIDDAVRETGSVRAEIKGDGKTLWESAIRGGEPARELELEIAGVKRLEIVADYGEDLDVGDRLDVAEARVTK